MTDTQILTLAIAIVFPVVVPLTVLMLSNSRLTDLRAMLQGSMNDTKEILRAEMNTHHTEQMALLRAVMDKLDEVDGRLTRLEQQR